MQALYEGHAAYSGEGELEERCLDSSEPRAAAVNHNQTHEEGVAVVERQSSSSLRISRPPAS